MVNLYSDTQTRPTSAMRKAMAEAEVGDEQRFEDPQVTELCSRVAELLGMQAAVFLPSGTMCNEIAFRLHIRPGGDEAILHRTSHPIIAEAGGPAAFAGAMMQPLDTPRGMFTGDDVRGALRYPSRYEPRSRLVSVEQTTNMAGGRVWPLEQLRGVVEVAGAAGLRLHMDGARLMNAVIASGVPAHEFTRGFDTAWLDFTKGLGAPLGACLAGSAELIEEAWRYKQMLGGAMRQAGIVAAGALYALDHHVERLAEDHENARALAQGLASVPGITLDPDEVETNIVIFEVDDPEGLCAAVQRDGVLMGPVGPRTVRAVTHLDVDADGVQRALKAVERAMR
ncbi:MAG TPA: GntG family PLP-dependent aldolase [Solirubrobacter sp.]|nr:GntG family PLP-dependent aldolase [Solirubrobacter sp.]